MRFLYDSKYAPLTDCMGFVETNLEIAFQKFAEWSFPQWASRVDKVKVSEFKLSFEELLLMMQPLKYPEKRLLFATTSLWTGYIENITAIRTETGRIRRISEPLNCRSIEIAAWPSKYGKKVNGWGGGFFTLNQGDEMIRHLMLSDQDRWEFDSYGSYLPFENIEKYKEKYARNRFTPELLDKYLKYFGINFFDENFYMPPNSKAYLIEIIRQPYPNEVSKTLDEIRKEMRYE